MTDIVTAITELRRNHNLAALPDFAGIPGSTCYYHYKKAQAGINTDRKKKKSQQSIKRIMGVTDTAGFS